MNVEDKAYVYLLVILKISR